MRYVQCWVIHQGRNNKGGQEGVNQRRALESQGLIATGFRGAKTSVRSSLLPKAPEWFQGPRIGAFTGEEHFESQDKVEEMEEVEEVELEGM